MRGTDSETVSEPVSETVSETMVVAGRSAGRLEVLTLQGGTIDRDWLRSNDRSTTTVINFPQLDKSETLGWCQVSHSLTLSLTVSLSVLSLTQDLMLIL